MTAGGAQVSQDKNIGVCFGRIAARIPDRPAVIAADLALSYDQLWQISQTFALRMRERGIDRGATVVLDTRDMVVSLATMFGCALLGARFLAFETGLLEQGAVVPTHFLKSPEQPGAEGVSYIEMDPSWSPRVAGPPPPDAAPFAGYAEQEDPWWIIHTSGTTGRPKYMTLSQRVVHDRSIAARTDFIPDRTVLCALFNCTARPFYVRATAALLNRCTVVDTVDVEFMRAHGVTLVCGSPRIAREWLDGRVLSPRIARLQVSGARLSDADAAAFLGSFDVVEDVYGSSETNKSFVNVKSVRDGQVISTGKPGDSEVQILDESFGLCPPGKTGTVRIRNPYMVDGYIDAPDSTAKAFQDGWFHPGDFAVWGPNGDLQITGRVDEVINLGGVKVDPVQVDLALLSVAGVHEAASFRNPHPQQRNQLVAFVTLEAGAEGDTVVPRAHQACVDALGTASAPQLILVVDRIPMTYDGVPRRSECQRMALNLMRKTRPGPR